MVSEKEIGEMRMQFWRDAIDLAFKVKFLSCLALMCTCSIYVHVSAE